jgi:hypothetical protein
MPVGSSFSVVLPPQEAVTDEAAEVFTHCRHDTIGAGGVPRCVFWLSLRQLDTEIPAH